MMRDTAQMAAPSSRTALPLSTVARGRLDARTRQPPRTRTGTQRGGLRSTVVKVRAQALAIV